jgi:hypothetical protein
MTRPQFETCLSILCARLSDLHEIYWTVTDLPALYETPVSEQPMPDVALLEWIVKRKVLKSITLAPGAVLDIARDGQRCVLFCRHYNALLIERLNEVHPEPEVQAALVSMWKARIKELGRDGAIERMKADFPGVYGMYYKEQLNESFKTACLSIK